VANAIIQRTERGTYVLVVGGKVRHEARTRALCAKYGARQKVYRGKTPRRAKPTIPPDIEDHSIKPIPLLARMSGDSYRTFLADAHDGRYGPLYELANGFGLNFGNWKRGMAARQIKTTDT
jgi:hypothetical protein